MGADDQYVEAVAEASEQQPDLSDRPTRSIERRTKARMRAVQALNLRAGGLTYQRIGDKMGISTSYARELVERALERSESRAVDEYRDMENLRLDTAQAAIWPGVLRGDLQHVDRFLRISERRSKLNGLDAPAKLNISMATRTEMELALQELSNIVIGEVVQDDDDDDGPSEVDRDAEVRGSERAD